MINVDKIWESIIDKIENGYNLKFEWEYIKEKANKYTIANGNKYAWLTPIKI